MSVLSNPVGCCIPGWALSNPGCGNSRGEVDQALLMVSFRAAAVWPKLSAVVWAGGWVTGRLVDVGVSWGWVAVGEGVTKACFTDCAVWEITLPRDWSMEGDWASPLWKALGSFTVAEGSVGWLWAPSCNFCVVTAAPSDKASCTLLMPCCRADLPSCNWALVSSVRCRACSLAAPETSCALAAVWLVARPNCWAAFCPVAST